MQTLTLLLLASLLALSTAEGRNYPVIPNDADCPNFRCLTFDDYVEQSRSYFRKGTTFQFFNGNHTLQRELELHGVSNITLKGASGQENTDIVCDLTSGITLLNAFNITLKGLTFLLHNYERDIDSALTLRSSSLLISNMIFRGNGNLNMYYLARAVYLKTASEIAITDSQ